MNVSFFELYNLLDGQFQSQMQNTLEVDSLSFQWPFNKSVNWSANKGSQRKSSGEKALLDDISFVLTKGKGISIKGITGSGKTTLAHLLCGRLVPTQGSIHICGSPLSYATNTQGLFQRANIQLVSQIPSLSFHPLKPLLQSIKEVFRMFRYKVSTIPDITQEYPNAKAFDHFVTKLLETHIMDLCEIMGIDQDILTRLPREVSGGQLQRCVILRSILTFPAVLILDEPVSHLDINVRIAILELIGRIQEEAHISIVLISHQQEVHEYFASKHNYLQYSLEKGTLSQY